MTYLLFLAIVPALALLFYVYKQDSVEKEPFKLLLILFLLGCLSTLPSMIFEILGTAILEEFLPGVPETSTIYMLIDNFIVVAITEEFWKRFMLRRKTWKNRNFNYCYDAIVYSVAVAMGFAAFENVMYLLDFGTELGYIRAVTAIPLHCIAGIFMGYYYGQEKYLTNMNNKFLAGHYRRMSLWIPVLIHGFYDYVATEENFLFTIIFLAYVITLDIFAFRAVRRYAKADKSVQYEEQDQI